MKVAVLFEVKRCRTVVVELGDVSRFASFRIVYKDEGEQHHLTQRPTRPFQIGIYHQVCRH